MAERSVVVSSGASISLFRAEAWSQGKVVNPFKGVWKNNEVFVEQRYR